MRNKWICLVSLFLTCNVTFAADNVSVSNFMLRYTLTDLFYVLVLLYALVCFIRGRHRNGIIAILFLLGLTLVAFLIARFVLLPHCVDN
jgi:hypothetical protein